MNGERPNPDELLERIEREEENSLRGKLKIFFGACAGVGKTYAMLSAAKQLQAQGVDLVVGVIETHGRKETEALLAGLEILPRKEIEYRGRKQAEFDLDAVLARRPSLVLVDELAHSNIQGSRHPKRWQDVEEILSAGIDVYTTVNVQHLESLNDVVGGITGIRIRETLPDKVFERADEVVLVDITPEELLQRLKEGKIYLPEQAAGAIRNFFRKGNLIALRELSLRRTADRVDSQMRTYRQERSIETVWQTRESLLLCLGPEPGTERIVRAGSRIARQLDAEWHAVYVETPRLQRLPEDERSRILKTLKLAQELGARSATLAGQDAAETLADYARSHNLSKLIVGRDSADRRRIWKRSFADRLGRIAPDLDLIQVAGEGTSEAMKERKVREKDANLRPYLLAAAVCGVSAAVAMLLFSILELTNIAMLFLLAVVFTAVRFGRGPAVLAAFLSVALFDFFFVPPRFTFAVSDAQYLLTFAVMLAVALIIGQLTANLHYQGRVAVQRERRLRALYETARDLSGAMQPEQIVELAHKYIEGTFGVRVALLFADDRGQLRLADDAPAVDAGVAQWCFDHSEAAGFGTDTLPGSPLLYLPLKAPMRIRGVLAVEPSNPRWLLIPEQRRQLDAFAALIATALERVHYIAVAQEALLKIESERLRNSVLSALSHDLRTPLTSLIGLAESLAGSEPELDEHQLDMTATIREQAFRMSALVEKLLDMARLEAGEIRLNRAWQPLEEVVGSALQSQKPQLAGRRIELSLPSDLPLVEFDAVLIERVFCNLLENAAKYTPPDSTVKIEAGIAGKDVLVSVSDNGPGLLPGSEEAIFEKFTRGETESATPGVGLGLAICRAIVEAHKGKIRAENIPAGGARFLFTLPLGNPPAIEEEPA